MNYSKLGEEIYQVLSNRFRNPDLCYDPIVCDILALVGREVEAKDREELEEMLDEMYNDYMNERSIKEDEDAN